MLRCAEAQRDGKVPALPLWARQFVDILPGRDALVGFSLHIRIDANRDISRVPRVRAGFDKVELAFGFHVKHQDTGLECRIHFLRSLAYAGEHDALGPRPPCERAARRRRRCRSAPASRSSFRILKLKFLTEATDE
jgi:hypothetical protein